MYLDDAKVVLKEVLKKTNITPFLWGERGIGKSQCIYQIAEELSQDDKERWDVVELRIGQMEVGDLIGIPKVENGTTIWARPQWFPVNGKGIIFLDEPNRDNAGDVTQAIFQLVLDKKLHTHVLPEGWKVVCAGNPAEGDYFVADFDIALMDRFMHLAIRPNTQTWLSWAKDSGICSEILDFIETNEDLLFISTIDNFNLDIKPTPRSYEMLHSILSDCDIPERLHFEIFAGLIGKEAATTFLKYRLERFDKPVSAEEIMFDYERVRNQILNARIDVLNSIINNVINYCADLERDVNEENLIAFLMDLNRDLLFGTVKRLIVFEHIKPILARDERLYDAMLKIYTETQVG